MSELSLEFEKGAETQLHDAPAYLMVVVGDGLEEESVTFSLVGDAGAWADFHTLDLDNWGMSIASVPIPAVPAGVYELTVVGEASTAASIVFHVLNDPLDDTEEDDETEAPAYPEWTPNLHRWRLIDTATVNNVGGWEFLKNPSRWTNPNFPNFLEHDVTTAPDGNVLAWEGAQRSWTFEFSGYLDTQEEYEALEFWSGLRRRFWLIDHRDKARFVTFDHFDARARIVPGKPWAHDYTIKVVHFYRAQLPD